MALALGIVGSISLGIGLIWIVPFLSIAIGLKYVRSVGTTTS